MDQVIIGVDIGGTNTVIGMFDDDLSLIKKTSVPSKELSIKNPEQFIQSLALEINRFAAHQTIISVGVAVPGKVDGGLGIVELATNLSWENVELAKGLSDILQVPVRIEHDVRSYTIGEAMKGAGVGYDNIVCLTIGTGMAVGTIVNGQLIAGSDFLAGELGHDTVPGISNECACGKIGCLETVVSAPGISRLAAEKVSSNKGTLLRLVEGKITALDVYEASEKGDAAAKEIFDYVGNTLAQKLATVVYLLNPEVIIIGGGVAAAGDFLLNPIRKTLEVECPFYIADLNIKIGQLGDSAGLIGVAHLAKESIKL
ncbi:ROK family protein [Lederbergia panacisoli]|uniref:ROK family protein n=1 Tax=Lederbergia panacisoli TaxID=1255251 RepID=UPI00214BDE1E|nr:ROK family protein [Lederbergia panacisoli]MCR2821514.1 ROK family protein [Lederbergia panacisoli]